MGRSAIKAIESGIIALFFGNQNGDEPEDAGARLGCVARFFAFVLLFLALTALAAAEDKTVYFHSVTVEQGLHEGSITCIFCDVVVKGELHGDIVAIWGSVTVYGKARGDIVAVGGAVRVENGAEANHDIVVIGGQISSASAAASEKEGHVAFPWVHLPGQRSFGWRGIAGLLGFNVVCALLPTLLLRPRAVRSVAKASRRWFLTSVVGIVFVASYSYGLDALDEYMHASDLVAGIFSVIFLAILGIGIAGITYAMGDRLFPGLLLASLAAGVAILTTLELVPYAGLLVMIVATGWATGSALLSGLGFRGPRPPKSPRTTTDLKLLS